MVADVYTAKHAAAPADRGEPVALVEPLAISIDAPIRSLLFDRALELVQLSASLRKGLPHGMLAPLADLIRAMNCYYSNLIEGHNTHPVDIERALNGDFSGDRAKRDLQLEARAHIEVQKWIDSGALKGRATAAASLCEIHRRFAELLPEELLWVSDTRSAHKERVKPGAFREVDVIVGKHVPVSPGAIPRFMERFEEYYRTLGKSDAILATAASHHRLLWIHPFMDGNGRVARLMTHAILLETLDSGALWSVARGLARNEQEYKRHLMACDEERRNDLDGRGNLSEEALASFTLFFLETCIDQVKFMESLMQPDRLRARIMVWAEEEIRLGALPRHSNHVLDAMLYRGELGRGEFAKLLHTSERNARRITSDLLHRGVLQSQDSRAPLRLAFPAALASRWMPGLFPEAPQ